MDLSNIVKRHLMDLGEHRYELWLRGYKKKFMLNSAEHAIYLLINLKMSTIIFSCSKMLKCQQLLAF